MTRQELQNVILQLQEWLNENAEAEVDISTVVPMHSRTLLNEPSDSRWGSYENPLYHREFTLYIKVRGRHIDLNGRLV